MADKPWDDTDWVGGDELSSTEWSEHAAEHRDIYDPDAGEVVSDVNNEAVNTTSLGGGVAGGGSVTGLHGTDGERHVIAHVPFMPGNQITFSSTSFTNLGGGNDRIGVGNPDGLGDMTNMDGDMEVSMACQFLTVDQDATVRIKDEPGSEVVRTTSDGVGFIQSPWVTAKTQVYPEGKLNAQTNGDEATIRFIYFTFAKVIGQ